VLTGGPCAGKTTALTELSMTLIQMGFKVLLVPEAATVMKKGGALIQTSKLAFSEAVKYQMNLMKLQMALEDVFIEIAQTSNQHTIILNDRGVMDGSAYTDEHVWQAILDEMGWSTIQLRDRRYEAIIHMTTAAEGAEEFYQTANNTARYETIDEAKAVDKRLINAWVGHPCFNIIKNTKKGFKTKLDYVK
jgi:predicted ATPase